MHHFFQCPIKINAWLFWKIWPLFDTKWIEPKRSTLVWSWMWSCYAIIDQTQIHIQKTGLFVEFHLWFFLRQFMLILLKTVHVFVSAKIYPPAIWRIAKFSSINPYDGDLKKNTTFSDFQLIQNVKYEGLYNLFLRCESGFICRVW